MSYKVKITQRSGSWFKVASVWDSERGSYYSSSVEAYLFMKNRAIKKALKREKQYYEGYKKIEEFDIK